MSKKMLIAGACVMALLLLVGCQADKESADDKATESATASFSASSEDTATETEEAAEKVATEETEGVINEVNSKDTEIVEKVAGVQENCGNVSDNVEKEQTDNQKSTGSAEDKQSGSTGQSKNSDQSLTNP